MKMTSECSIKFNEVEGRDGFIIPDEISILSIFPSRSSQKVTNSSKIKLTNVVDYSWEAQSGIGRLIATHYSGKYIAYCVKVAGSGAVRVVDLETKDRVLMRGNRGLIRDVEFMHNSEELVLGFIDEYGSFYVYKIVRNPKIDKMETLLVLNVELDGSPTRSDCRRFIWCRCVPDAGETGDESDGEGNVARDSASYQFAIIQNSMVYVANVLSLVRKHGEGVHSFQSLKSGYLAIDSHSDLVVDASFAPDGTAIATASKDGTVKFFQIYLISETHPRCLYSWSPHEGDPVSKIFFLDDYTLSGAASETPYWKFVITAGPNMNEIKLWNCVKWECVQALRFSCTSPFAMKMDMNANSKFLVITDAQRKVMYVVHVMHDEIAARFQWVNEFSIPVPVLDFNMRRAEICNLRKVVERGFEHYVSEEDSLDACMVDIIFVQPKSLMEASVAFHPPIVYADINGRTPSRISFDDSVSFKDEDEKEDEEIGIEDILEPSPKARRSLSPISTTKIPSPRSQPNIKSRDSPNRRSSSPVRKPTSTSVSHLTQQLSSLIGVGIASPNSSLSRANISLENPFATTLEKERNEAILPIRVRTSSTNGNLSNASSSPSREVEEILSPKNSETMIHKTEISAFHLLETEYVVPTLDVEGNVIDPRDLTQKHFSPITIAHKLPTKSKSLSAAELTPPQIPQVLEQVNSIMDMMKVQAQELKELRSEVSRLNNAQQFNARQLDEGALTKAVDKFSVLNESGLRRLEDSFKNTMMSLEKRNLPTAFAENMTLDLAHVIKTEIESSVLPQVLRIFEPVCLHLNSELDTIVRNAEAKVKQYLGQMINGQEFKNALKDQVVGSMKSVCDGAISDVLCTSVCPSFEKSLQGLFETINETFMKGTKEYMTGVETSVTTSRSQHEDLQDSIKRLFDNMQDTLSSILQVEVESQLRHMTNGMQDGLMEQFEETLSREISRAFLEQQKFFEVSVIPRTTTPAPPICDSTVTPSPAIDPAVRLAQLNALIDSGDVTGAFSKAANIADHSILMSLAQKVPPSRVFIRDLPTVIHLSIVQQMANDISTFTETKLLYLQTAVGTLNLSDAKVLRSLSRIIPVFQSSLNRFIAGNPDSPLIGNLKFLEMAFVGIGNRSQHLTPLSRNH